MSKHIQVEIKMMSSTAIMPTRGSAAAAGWDLYADLRPPEDTGTIRVIYPHTTSVIGTGFALAIPDGWEGQIRPRSGLATKSGLRPANTPGTIDSDYRGEIKVALHNDTDVDQYVYHGDRIAQIVFSEVPEVVLLPVLTLSDTERGEGGFGSSGK